MPVSPAVLSKGKKTQKSTNSVSFSDAVSASSPVASTSKVPIADSSSQDDAQMEDDDGVEGDGEWQSARPTATSTSEASKENSNAAVGEEEDDDAVMIDSNTLLPPVGSSNAEGGATGADQGLLKFPALSAKEVQGKVETQSRKVSVRLNNCLRSAPTLLQHADDLLACLLHTRHLKILPARACLSSITTDPTTPHDTTEARLA